MHGLIRIHVLTRIYYGKFILQIITCSLLLQREPTTVGINYNFIPVIDTLSFKTRQENRLKRQGKQAEFGVRFDHIKLSCTDKPKRLYKSVIIEQNNIPVPYKCHKQKHLL